MTQSLLETPPADPYHQLAQHAGEQFDLPTYDTHPTVVGLEPLSAYPPVSDPWTGAPLDPPDAYIAPPAGQVVDWEKEARDAGPRVVVIPGRPGAGKVRNLPEVVLPEIPEVDAKAVLESLRAAVMSGAVERHTGSAILHELDKLAGQADASRHDRYQRRLHDAQDFLHLSHYTG